jgi:hypothetical protein
MTPPVCPTDITAFDYASALARRRDRLRRALRDDGRWYQPQERSIFLGVTRLVPCTVHQLEQRRLAS